MFEYPVVFVDIETTGGSYRNSRVLEVAAIRVENGVITGEFSSLVHPGTSIPPKITQITGITEHDIVDAPAFEDIADELHEILQGAIFVAHNVRFDYSFLKQEFSLVGTDFHPKLLCTVRLSRLLYADRQGHSLGKLIERHSIPYRFRHRALDDARAIHYFSQLAYDEHGKAVFEDAVNRQLRSQYVPSHLDSSEIETIKDEPGVYIFEDEQRTPIYIGKSIHLKKRVVSHFQDQAARELKMSQHVHHVRVIPTQNELSALLLESQMVKEHKPLYNRQLRRVSKYALLVKSTVDEYATLRIDSGTVDEAADLGIIYGLYESRTKAKNRIIELTKTFQLCPKLMGFENTKTACFSHSLGRCKGACIGLEEAASYNRRFELALMHSKLEAWPYKNAIAIPFDAISGVVINNWMVQGFYDSGEPEPVHQYDSYFDLDEYKIIRRFIRTNAASIIPLAP
ncbi:MAG: polC [Candidatus Saccharibacteria bacterium]|nr:polC [Candidatus Saccharibacteria bacterium]